MARSLEKDDLRWNGYWWEVNLGYPIEWVRLDSQLEVNTEILESLERENDELAIKNYNLRSELADF